MDKILNLVTSKNRINYDNAVMLMYVSLVDRGIIEKKDDLYLFANSNISYDNDLARELNRMSLPTARQNVELGQNMNDSISIMSLELADLIMRLFDDGSINPSFVDLSGQNINLAHSYILHNKNIPNVLFSSHIIHSGEYVRRMTYEILGDHFANVINEVNDKYDYVFSFIATSRKYTTLPTGINGYHFPLRFGRDFRAIDAALNLYNKKAIILTRKKVLYSLEGSEYRNMLIKSGLLEAIIEIPASFPRMRMEEMCLLVFSKDNKNVKVINGNSYEVDNTDGLKNEKLINMIISDYHNSTSVKSFEELTEYSNMSPSSIDSKDSNKFENSKKLSEYAEVFSGTQYTRSFFLPCISNNKTGVKLLLPSDISNGEFDSNELLNIDLDNPEIGRFKKYGVEQFSIKEGDILITTKTSIIKKCFVEETPEDSILAAGGMLVVRPKDENSKNILKAFFSSEKGNNLLNSIVKGHSVKIITLTDLSNLEIPEIKLEKNKEVFEKTRLINERIKCLKKELFDLENMLKNLTDEIDFK